MGGPPGGTLYPRYGIMPVSQCAKVRHDSELQAHFARLKLGSGNFGAVRIVLASLAALPAPVEFRLAEIF